MSRPSGATERGKALIPTRSLSDSEHRAGVSVLLYLLHKRFDSLGYFLHRFGRVIACIGCCESVASKFQLHDLNIVHVLFLDQIFELADCFRIRKPLDFVLFAEAGEHRHLDFVESEFDHVRDAVVYDCSMHLKSL